MDQAKVLILIGSDSDYQAIQLTKETLDRFGIGYRVRIHSAHRTPEETERVVKMAEGEGYSLIIAAAGLAAHLPGFCAALSPLPVIGVPLESGPLGGKDSLYSIVQMPSGVPVGCMGIGKTGAKNAGFYAVQILSIKYPELRKAWKEFREEQRRQILKKDAQIDSSVT